MKTFNAFLAGMVTGWVARSAVDSSRGAIVVAVSSLYDAIEWVKRAAATEREYFSDMFAEARARHRPHVVRPAAQPPPQPEDENAITGMNT